MDEVSLSALRVSRISSIGLSIERAVQHMALLSGAMRIEKSGKFNI